MLRYGIQAFVAKPGCWRELRESVVGYWQGLVAHGFLSRKDAPRYEDPRSFSIFISGLLCGHNALECAPRSDALKNSYADLEQHLVAAPVSQYFEAASTEDDTYCAHKEKRPLLLACNYHLGISSLVCMECRGTIPSYELGLPPPIEGRLWNWERHYDHIYACWSMSDDYENWAEGELFSIDSKLNLAGRQIAADIAREHGTRVWYYLPAADPNVGRPECPGCGGPWRTEPVFAFGQACDTCMLVT